MGVRPSKYKLNVFIVIGAFLLIAVVGYSQNPEKSYYQRSREFLDLKKLKQAEQYADSALLSAIASNNLDSMMNAYLWLSNVQSVKQDHLKALQYFKMVIVYRDSLEAIRLSELDKKAVYERLTRDESNERKVASLKKSIDDLQHAADQQWRNMLIILAAMFFLSVVVIVALVRKMNNTQQLITKANDELESLQFFRQRLSTIISSNLQSSLNSFESLTQNLSKQFDDLPQEQRLKLLNELGDTATELKSGLNNVTQWISYQADSSLHRPSNINCRKLAERTLVKFSSEITSKGVNTQVFMQDGIMVYADEEMVDRILDHLFSNALRNTPPGGMITLLSGRKDGLATLGVRDTGAGISPSEIGKLFDNTSDSIGTNDVALILCKELVEKNGGRIYAESVPGQGTTIYFSLPEPRT